MLGHYDPSHNAIILSRIFDNPELPRLGLEYVMFHEMLHLRHAPEHGYAKRRVHTKSFREAERGYPLLAEARLLLKKICAAARRAV
jgi:predicted metal-dependent hydrolase